MTLHKFRCPPDCPKRSETCHSTCKTYKEDCEINERKKALKNADKDVDSYMHDRAMINRDRRALRKKYKNHSENK